MWLLVKYSLLVDVVRFMGHDASEAHSIGHLLPVDKRLEGVLPGDIGRPVQVRNRPSHAKGAMVGSWREREAFGR